MFSWIIIWSEPVFSSVMETKGQVSEETKEGKIQEIFHDAQYFVSLFSLAKNKRKKWKVKSGCDFH